MKMMFAASYIACPCVSCRCVLSANRTMPSCGVLNVNPIICSVLTVTKTFTGWTSFMTGKSGKMGSSSLFHTYYP